jgi:hypothetical protein
MRRGLWIVAAPKVTGESINSCLSKTTCRAPKGVRVQKYLCRSNLQI